MVRKKVDQHREKAVRSHHLNADTFANRYQILEKDPYANAFVYGRKKIFELIIPLVKERVPKGSSVLDVGAGTGYLADQLKREGFVVTALEPAQGMRKQALRHYPGLNIVDGEVTKLPLADNTFMLVTAIEVFRYLPEEDIKKGLAECLRVLKPGGYLLITLVNKYALDGFIFKYYGRVLAEKMIGHPAVNYCHFDTPGGTEEFFLNRFNLRAETYGRMFAPLRAAYLISNSFGRLIARRLESLDDWLDGKNWHKPLAGHLIVVVKK